MSEPDARPEFLLCLFCKEFTDWMQFNRTRIGFGKPVRVYAVICKNCGASGPEMPTEVEAVAEWNGVKR